MRLVARLDDCSQSSSRPKSRSSAELAAMYGSSVSCGLLALLTVPRPRRTPGGGHRARLSLGVCQICRWCRLFHPSMMRLARSTKSDAQSVACCHLNNGHNPSSSTMNFLKSSKGCVCYASDIVRMVLRTRRLPLPPPAPAGGSVGSVDATSPTTSWEFNIAYVPSSNPPQPSPSKPLGPPSHPSTSNPSPSQPSGLPSQPGPSQPSPSRPSGSLSQPLRPPSQTLPSPYTELQRVSSRTRSKMAQFSNTPTIQFSAMLVESSLSPPVQNGEGFNHSTDLVSMMVNTGASVNHGYA